MHLFAGAESDDEEGRLVAAEHVDDGEAEPRLSLIHI